MDTFWSAIREMKVEDLELENASSTDFMVLNFLLEVVFVLYIKASD